MADTTTIQVETSTKDRLDTIGNKGQTYDEIINQLADEVDEE